MAAGSGIAEGLNAFTSLDLSLRTPASCSRPRTAIVGVLVATLVTLVAGLSRRGGRRRCPVARCVTPIGPQAASARAPCGGGVAGRPSGGRHGGSGRPAARRNAMRNPAARRYRSALMIGVTLVTAVTVVANGLRETKGTLDERIAATHVITAQDGWSPIDPEIARTAASAPGVRPSARCAGRRPRGRRQGDRQLGAGRQLIGVRVAEARLRRGPLRAGADGAVIDDGWPPSTASRSATLLGDLGEGHKLPLDGPRDRGLPVLDPLGLGLITVSQGVRPAFETSATVWSLVSADSATAAAEQALARIPTRTC